MARHPQPVLFIGALGGVAWLVWEYARSTDAFRIADIAWPAGVSFQVDRPLLGSNLWEVDIGALAQELRSQQPSLKDVRVVRQPPNALRIEAIPRISVAQVRLSRWHPVDGGGFVLREASPEPSSALIRIVGIETSGQAIKAGKENDHERLALALRIVERLRRSPLAISRRVTEVNVADSEQLRLLVDDETEVRCGAEPQLDAHLDRLRAALAALAKQPMAVRYIDVRFQEPVISPRT